MDCSSRYCDIAAEEARSSGALKIAGIVGPTEQAVREAELAGKLGYDAGLLSLGALRDASIEQLIAHAKAVASVIPLFGFYLQPSVGGRLLPYEFWREFADIENVVAIKIAPFNRYQTLDVVRAVAESGRDIALYTGNDDSILVDLLTEFDFGGRKIHFAGGLLGHWSVWTRRAVEHLELARTIRDGANGRSRRTCSRSRSRSPIRMRPSSIRKTGFAAASQACTKSCAARDCSRARGAWMKRNASRRDRARQIDRVYRAYPHLMDDDFVRSTCTSS